MSDELAGLRAEKALEKRNALERELAGATHIADLKLHFFSGRIWQSIELAAQLAKLIQGV